MSLLTSEHKGNIFFTHKTLDSFQMSQIKKTGIFPEVPPKVDLMSNFWGTLYSSDFVFFHLEGNQLLNLYLIQSNIVQLEGSTSCVRARVSAALFCQ